MPRFTQYCLSVRSFAIDNLRRGQGIDEGQFNALEALRNNASENEQVPMSHLKEKLRQQAAVLRADEPRALRAIPKMLPSDPSRQAKAIATIYDVVNGRRRNGYSDGRAFRRNL
jgi:hypothetical protein